MKNIKSVKDFGARGDGIHDDHGAIQAALDGGADEIIIPQGIYCVFATLKVPSNTCITADKTAKLIMKGHTRKKRGDFLLTNADTKNGNCNIRISGGIWDGNNSADENRKPDIFDKNGYSGVLLNFANVNGLTLNGMVLANSVTYYVRMSSLQNFAIEDISLISDNFGCNQDGLHFGGNVRHGSVKNIRALSVGQPNDDLIALNADDSIERVENLDLVRGVIEDITFENIYAENCHTVIRLLSVTAAIKNIHFKNVYAGYRCYAVNADGARYCHTPLFMEEEYPEGIGVIENVSFENFTCRPITELPENWNGTGINPVTAFVLETKMTDFKISNFRLITSETANIGKIFALKAKNLTDITVAADKTTFLLKEKSDILILESFTELVVNKTV